MLQKTPRETSPRATSEESKRLWRQFCFWWLPCATGPVTVLHRVQSVCCRSLQRAVLSPFPIPWETPSAARHTSPFYFSSASLLLRLAPCLPPTPAAAKCFISCLPLKKGRGSHFQFRDSIEVVFCFWLLIYPQYRHRLFHFCPSF